MPIVENEAWPFNLHRMHGNQPVPTGEARLGYGPLVEGAPTEGGRTLKKKGTPHHLSEIAETTDQCQSTRRIERIQKLGRSP